jgi:hypothetical protein
MIRMKKVFIYFLIFSVFGFLFTLASLRFVDNYIYNMNNSSSILDIQDELKKETLTINNNLKLPSDVDLVQYSYNNKYYSYLKDGAVEIYKSENKELFDIIKEDKKICFYNLLYDKNLIVYFVEDTKGTSTKLTLKTYELSSKRKTEYNKFNVTDFDRIKQIEFSPIINIIYLNIENKNNTSTIYRIDLFNSMSTVFSGKEIEKLIMLKHKDRLYYQLDNKDVYYAGGRLNLFKNKVNMIGTDLDDNIYFIDVDKTKVYKVKDNKIIKTIELSDNNAVNCYSDNTAVYIIFPNYIIDVSSDDVYKRICKLSNYVTFETIKTDTVYLKTKDNIIVTTNLNSSR